MSADVDNPEVEETAPSLEPPAPEAPKGVTVTEDEIAAAEAELSKLEERARLADELEKRPPFNPIDHNELAKSLKGALEPLVPKPPSNKTYDNEEMLANFKNFRGALDALIADKLSEFFESKINPFSQQLNQIHSVLPQLYLRSQENPQFKLVDAEARRIEKEYGIGYWQALRGLFVTTNEINIDKGPADFASIMRDLRSKYGNNI